MVKQHIGLKLKSFHNAKKFGKYFLLFLLELTRSGKLAYLEVNLSVYIKHVNQFLLSLTFLYFYVFSSII